MPANVYEGAAACSVAQRNVANARHFIHGVVARAPRDSQNIWRWRKHSCLPRRLVSTLFESAQGPLYKELSTLTQHSRKHARTSKCTCTAELVDTRKASRGVSTLQRRVFAPLLIRCLHFRLQGLQALFRAHKERPREGVIREDLIVDHALHARIQPQSSQVLQAKIAIAIDFRTSEPRAQIGLTCGIC